MLVIKVMYTQTVVSLLPRHDYIVQNNSTKFIGFEESKLEFPNLLNYKNCTGVPKRSKWNAARTCSVRSGTTAQKTATKANSD